MQQQQQRIHATQHNNGHKATHNPPQHIENNTTTDTNTTQKAIKYDAQFLDFGLHFAALGINFHGFGVILAIWGPPGGSRGVLEAILMDFQWFWELFWEPFSWFWHTFFRWILWCLPGSIISWFWLHFDFISEPFGSPFLWFFENVEKVRFEVLPAREPRKSRSWGVRGCPL